ncbi:MAG: dihydrofolate reductase family protein [Geminicoccaceae bacterium]
MPHVTYFVAASLDGRIAGPGDDLAFLELFAGTFADGPYNMSRLIAGFDSLVMGAATYRFIAGHVGDGSRERWPYGETPTWVLSRAPALPPIPGAEAVIHARGDIAAVVDGIAARGLSRTWLVGGGNLAAQFLAADLVDELILGLAPAILGAGPPLADGALPLRTFDLADVQRDRDALALRYVRRR